MSQEEFHLFLRTISIIFSSLLVVYISYRITRKKATLDYLMQLFSNQELDTARNDLIRYRNENGKVKLSSLADNEHRGSDSRKNILIILNNIELTAIAIDSGAIDLKMFKKMRSYITLSDWELGSDFVIKLRDNTGSKKLFENAEKLILKLS